MDESFFEFASCELMDESFFEFASQQILGIARKMWPTVDHLEVVDYRGDLPSVSAFYVMAGDNRVAVAYIDPADMMPWVKPTGSTYP